ncbi:unnamed protein product [Auanema sp. JU1783]|nr:unnamed protein product [Auanema sp. JU1783]
MIPRCILFFLLVWITVANAAATPTYKYLKELCPDGYLPLTGKAHVRTCEDNCPMDSKCMQGICCIKPPTCLDIKFKFSTGYSCLPKIKQNCPSSSQCVPSSRLGMSICCSEKTTRRTPAATLAPIALNDNGVCPAGYPVIQREKNHLVLCKDCKDGICVPFRSSDVSVCCQSYGALCGAGSHVQMDGVLARDCSRSPCDRGYECSTTATGSQVCCSYALCPGGRRARSVCAGGCRLDEKCEEIQGQRWCCPLNVRQYQCPDNRASNGEQCSIFNPTCPSDHSCMEAVGGKAFICCEKKESEFTLFPTLPTTQSIPSIFTRESSVSLRRVTPVPTTRSPLKRKSELVVSGGDDDESEEVEDDEEELESEEPICPDGTSPMITDGAYLTCPEEGAPCPRAGYICQTTTNKELYCCPLDVDNWLVTTTKATTPKSNKKIPKKGSPLSLGPKTKPIVPMPIESDPPTCWFGHLAARYEHNNEIRRCSGFLDISCPFGYKCLPSSGTPGFLCCKA